MLSPLHVVFFLSLASLTCGGFSPDLRTRKLLDSDPAFDAWANGNSSPGDSPLPSRRDSSSHADSGDVNTGGETERRTSPIQDSSTTSGDSSRRDTGPEDTAPSPAQAPRRGGNSPQNNAPYGSVDTKPVISNPPPQFTDTSSPIPHVDNPFDGDEDITEDIVVIDPLPDFFPRQEGPGEDPNDPIPGGEDKKPFNALGPGLCRGQDVTGNPGVGNHYTVDTGITRDQCIQACASTGSCIGYAFSVMNFCEVYFTADCSEVTPHFGAGCSTGLPSVDSITLVVEFGDPWLICYVRDPGVPLVGAPPTKNSPTSAPTVMHAFVIPNFDSDNFPTPIRFEPSRTQEHDAHSSDYGDYGGETGTPADKQEGSGNTAVFVATVFIFFLMFGFAFYVAIAVIRSKSSNAQYNDIEKGAQAVPIVPGLDQSYHELNDDFVFEESVDIEGIRAPQGQPQSTTKIPEQL